MKPPVTRWMTSRESAAVTGAAKTPGLDVPGLERYRTRIEAAALNAGGRLP
jgi:hypothetical protein